MNVVSDWSENKVFPTMQVAGKKSVLVVDRAMFYTAFDDNDRWPVTSWNKARLYSVIDR